MRHSASDLITYTKLNRLANSSGPSYKVYKDGSDYYAEANFPSSTDYSGTNLTTVLHNCRDALSTGGTIKLGQGTFTLSTQLNLNSNINLEGSGWGTILTTQETGPADVYIVFIGGTAGTHKTGCRVANMKILAAANDNHPIFMDYCDQTIIEGCWIREGEECINVDRASERNFIINNFIDNAYEGGIEIVRDSKHNLIAGNHLKDCPTTGSEPAIFLWEGAGGAALQQEYNSVIGNIIDGGINDGIYGWGPRRSIIQGNSIYNVTKRGIYLRGADGTYSPAECVVDGNLVDTTGDDAMEIEGDRHTISNNIIIDATKYGIDVLADNTSVTGNMIYSCTQLGIGVISKSNVTIANNIIDSNVQHGIQLYGASGCTIRGNIIKDNDFANTNSYDGIHVGDNSDNNLIIGNTILDNDGYEIEIRANTEDNNVIIGNYIGAQSINDVGTGTIIRSNLGYLTESKGTSTGTGAQQTIAHGLVSTPNNVTVIPSVTGATVTSVWADATNIYCTVTNAKAYGWTASII